MKKIHPRRPIDIAAFKAAAASPQPNGPGKKLKRVKIRKQRTWARKLGRDMAISTAFAVALLSIPVGYVWYNISKDEAAVETLIRTVADANADTLPEFVDLARSTLRSNVILTDMHLAKLVGQDRYNQERYKRFRQAKAGILALKPDTENYLKLLALVQLSEAVEDLRTLVDFNYEKENAPIAEALKTNILEALQPLAAVKRAAMICRVQGTGEPELCANRAPKRSL